MNKYVERLYNGIIKENPTFVLINAVVALGIDGGDGKKHWIGTGFIVGRKEIDNPNLSTYYIITNKHVIEQEKYVYH